MAQAVIAQAPTRVAIIGCGYFAQFHHDAWARMASSDGERNTHVVGVCDRDEGRAREAAVRHPGASVYTDPARLIADLKPDLVDIVTPPATHAPLIALCADAGIDAICQKPLAPTLPEAEALVARAERAGITVVVHENFRFQPWYVEAKRLIEAGRLGALHGIAFRMRPGDGQGPDAYLARQPYFQQMPRFLIHETGIHFVDTFRMLIGEIIAVTARLRRINPVMAGEDAGIVMFEFEGDATGLLDANRLNDHIAQNTRLTMGEMWLEGANGVLRLDGEGRLFWKPHDGEEHPHTYRYPEVGSEPGGFGGDCVYATNSAALSALRSGVEPVNTGRAYLRNMNIVEAIYRSSEQGRRVKVC
jgi:predicted dehydrogenase